MKYFINKNKTALCFHAFSIKKTSAKYEERLDAW
jgi:hypothetical protein